MEQLINTLGLYSEYITFVILLLFIVAFIAFIMVIKSLNKTKKRYRSLIRGMGNKNLEEVILSNAQKIELLEEEVKENNNNLELLGEEINKCIKNVSIKRYNAFEGVGGEQSFSIAMLDEEGSGIIITSIHGREDARTYAKPIIEGRSKYTLSEEEKVILSSTLYKKVKN